MKTETRETVYFTIALIIFAVIMLLCGLGVFGEGVQNWVQSINWWK